MVHSHLSYGILVWGGTVGTGGFTKLQHLQNRIMNNLFSFHVEGNISTIFKSQRILKVSDTYRTKACCTLYKCLNNGYMPDLYNTLLSLTRVHFYPKRNRRNFYLPIPRVRAIQLNFIYKALTAWNSLRPCLRDQVPLSAFRRELLETTFDTY